MLRSSCRLHRTKMLRCRCIDAEACCCSQNELQALLLQTYYEDQLAVCRATEAILREEASLLSGQVRAGSFTVLPAQAS